MYFQHTAAQYINCHFVKEALWLSKGILYQSKTETQRSKLQSYSFVSGIEGWNGSVLPSLLPAAYFSLGMVPLPVGIAPWKMSLVSSTSTILSFQHNPGFTFTAPHMAFPDLHAGTALPCSAWPQSRSFFLEEDRITLYWCVLHGCKASTMWWGCQFSCPLEWSPRIILRRGFLRPFLSQGESYLWSPCENTTFFILF